MVHDRCWKWKAVSGYIINRESGMVQKQEGSACTLHFYLAEPGDVLHLLDDGYEYGVATYGFEVDLKYIYTYDYQPEENWTQYRYDFSEETFTQKDYVFEERCYFRVIIRKKPGQQGTDAIEALRDLSLILQWRTPVQPERQEKSDTEGVQSERTEQDSLADAWEEEIRDTVREVCSRKSEESLQFLLMSDSHYTVNGTWEDTVRNLRQVTKRLTEKGVSLDGFLHLGDMTDGLVPAEITTDYVAAVQEDIKGLGMPLYYVLGNHDSNYFRKNPERFSESEMRRLYLPEQHKGYYYKDFPEQYLRMIFLESFDPAEQVRYGFPEEELDWLEDILHRTPSDWHVLVFSHVPPTPRLHYWSKEIRGSQRLLRILRGFPRLLGFIHGHNHADQIDYVEGFPIISIGCNKCEYFEDKKPDGAVSYERKLESLSQDLWDVLVVSARKRTLDFIRFGAGENRHVVSVGAPTTMPKETPHHVTQKAADKIYRDRSTGAPMKKVITYGTFDLFHEGHYNILKRAKALGDYLIVGVTTEYYDEQRGKLNIVDSLLERIENVRETGLVDEIIIEDHEGQKIEDVQKYGVDIFTLGSDWKGVFDYLKPYCQVVYLERTPDISSTMLRKGKFPIIRMGVVGTGRIAPRFLSEAKFVSGLNVRCAYNPHRESVERFTLEYCLEGYSGVYEEFLEAVDAVYIAAPHETHFDYTRRALLAGKHVICEKPMAFTCRQVEELFSLARERHLVLMEGIKTAYCPGFAQMINIAKSGKIGEIKDVEACFSRLTQPHLREMTDIRYGGAFMEFGSYTVLPILKLLGLQYKDVKISSIQAENGVDLYTKIYFDYAEGMATSKTGLGVKSEGQLLISGTKGYILAESPWWLTRKFQVRYEDPNKIETYNSNFLGDGLRYEIGEFVSRINGRSGHAFKLTEEESVAMADVVERFLEERGKQRALFQKKNQESGVKIWAHRGSSYRYPENTLEAFQAACELPGLAGIELDIQLSKDGELVVFHDETLDRLMDGSGNVRDYTLAQLQQMQFMDWLREQGKKSSDGGSATGHNADNGRRLPRIPSMREVLELVRPYALERGVRINIELKNSRVSYEGMEKKILALVAQYGMEDYIVYSSFNGESIRLLKEMDCRVRTGILHSDIRECIRLVSKTRADDLHPNVASVTGESGWDSTGIQGQQTGIAIRAWNSAEPFYGQVRQYVVYDLTKLSQDGITDFITNVPEEYLVTVDGSKEVEKRA